MATTECGARPFSDLLNEVCSATGSTSDQQERFERLLETPGGPFKDAHLPLIDSIASLAEHVTKVELQRLGLSPSYIDSEDVAQAALLVFFENRQKIRDRGKLRSWFWSVMRRKAREQLGGDRVFVEVSDSALIDREPVADSTLLDAVPFAGSSAAARRQAVRAAVRDLSPKLRRVVILHALRGQTHEETARRLRIKPSTVRVRWLRAARILKARLAGTTVRP